MLSEHFETSRFIIIIIIIIIVIIINVLLVFELLN